MTARDKQPKLKRHWIRFSLQTFLIVLTIFCICTGWFLYRVEKQREAVKWVRENGGTVRYDYEYDGIEIIEDAQPTAPKWLLDLLGVDYFSTVTVVDGVSTGLSDLKPLAPLKNLRYLDLSDSQVSDVTPLAGLTSLESLSLHHTHVSDVTPLAGLTSLELLWLGNSQVRDVKPLAGLTNLEYLYLSETQVSDVTPLAGLTNLEYLLLTNTQVSDVKPLASLTNLEYLYLFNTQVSDEDIEKLKQALPNCKISNGGR